MRACQVALFAAALLLAASSGAQAADPRQIGTFGAWKAYAFKDKGNDVCFMSAAPEKQEGDFKKRGEVMMFVTHWPAEGTQNAVTLSMGFSFAEDATVALEAGGETFTLETDNETAFSGKDGADAKIAEALVKGTKVVVKSQSRRGTKVTDTYSLKGSGDAMKAIGKACGIKD